MSFHSATISTIFKYYNSLLMLQSSLFNVNTNKIPESIGVMKFACTFSHYKEKMDLHASLHHQEYCQYQKYLLKLSGDYQLSKFRLSEGTAVYSSSNFTRNTSFELVLQHNAKALSALLLDVLIFMCSFIYRELVDRRYDSRNTLKKFCYKCFKCLYLAMTF